MSAPDSALDLAALAVPPAAETLAFNARLEALLAQATPTHLVPPEQTRAARARGEGIFPSGGPLDSARWAPADTPLGRLRLTMPQGAPQGVALHVHGGGWTLGRPEDFDARCADTAAATGLAVVSAPYRLAPEHPWPACADDVEAAARWLATGGAAALAGEAAAGRLAIMGESAGAHLAVVALLRLRAAGLGGAFKAASLYYGAFDLGMTPSMAAWGARQLVLSTPTVAWFIANLGLSDPRDPAVSPLYADLRGLPPTLLQVGTQDPLLDDSLLMAARLTAAGVPATLRITPGGVHAFELFDLAVAREAQAAEAAFLTRTLTSA